MHDGFRTVTAPAGAHTLRFAALAAMLAILTVLAWFAAAAPAGAQVNSSNVTAVTHSGGRFVKLGPRQWQEQGNNGATFNFEELGPDESTLYLIDRSRNVQIGLDVSRGMIIYSHNNEPFRDLYRMTGMQSRTAQAPRQPQQQADTQTVTYSCNEGIPLVVRYVNTASTSLAFVSHDSFPEVRLEIAPSGSGSRYVGNGYELHAKGDTAIITINGSQDICKNR